MNGSALKLFKLSEDNKRIRRNFRIKIVAILGQTQKPKTASTAQVFNLKTNLILFLTCSIIFTNIRDNI